MSEFEVFVKEGLEKMGYQVDPQVGVSGFFIDLGVKHKSFPDGYILGVECDGRAYHSSKSQRDNDILRQSVLEDLAFKGHELPGLVLNWRQVSKLKNTYSDSLPEHLNLKTNRVHTSFLLAATTTGRLASSDPNLQLSLIHI